MVIICTASISTSRFFTAPLPSTRETSSLGHREQVVVTASRTAVHVAGVIF